MIHTEIKTDNRNCHGEDPDVRLSKDFQAAVTNMFKALKTGIKKEREVG